MTEVDAVLQAALAYARRGWSVIPLQHGEKRPLVRWMPYQRQAAAEPEIRDWFHRWPDANVGIVTGIVSGLVVLDIDAPHGGEAALSELEQRHGRLQDTVEAITGGGGRHLYFGHPGVVVRNKVGLAPGIDLRGDDGMVVAPPSLHPSGRRYAWAPSHSPEEAVPAVMPDWLHRLAVGTPGRLGHSAAYWRQLVLEGVPEGQRNNTIASLTGHLLWHGVDTDVALELLLCWNRVRCRPPLPEDEVTAVVRSIARLHERERTSSER